MWKTGQSSFYYRKKHFFPLHHCRQSCSKDHPASSLMGSGPEHMGKSDQTLLNSNGEVQAWRRNPAIHLYFCNSLTINHINLVSHPTGRRHEFTHGQWLLLYVTQRSSKILKPCSQETLYRRFGRMCCPRLPGYQKQIWSLKTHSSFLRNVGRIQVYPPPPVETRKLAFLFLNESIMKRDETVTVVVAEWLMTIRYFHNTKHTNAAARIPWAQTQRPLAPKFYCEIPHPLLWAGSRISCAKTRVTDIIIAHFYRTHIIYPDLHSEYLTSEPLAGSEHFKIGQLIRTVKYANDLGLQAKKGTVLQGITDILTEIEKRYKIKLL